LVPSQIEIFERVTVHERPEGGDHVVTRDETLSGDLREGDRRGQDLEMATALHPMEREEEVGGDVEEEEVVVEERGGDRRWRRSNPFDWVRVAKRRWRRRESGGGWGRL
jgi:hypothetical protein